jgi:hypothetical protein
VQQPQLGSSCRIDQRNFSVFMYNCCRRPATTALVCHDKALDCQGNVTNVRLLLSVP